MWRLIFRKKYLIAGVLIVCAIGYLLYRRQINFFEKKTEVTRGSVVETLVLSGEIAADYHAFLRFPTSGKIDYVGVEEGQEVKEGQVVARLDTSLLNSDFQKAKSALRLAEANLESTLDEIKGNDTTETFEEKSTRTKYEVAKDQAYEDYRKAEYNLRNSSLYAPFDGVVVNLYKKTPGLQVLATENVAEILDPESIYFSLTADQTEIDSIALGDEVTIVMDTNRDLELKGKVEYISLAPDQEELGSVYSVKVKLDDNFNEGNKVIYRLGMTGDAYFEIARAVDVFTVPSEYLQYEGDEAFLYLDKGRSTLAVEVGIQSEEKSEIQAEELREGLAVYDK